MGWGTMIETKGKWSNQSVKKLANDEDPISYIAHKARQLVLDGMEQGLAGPPINLFELAKLININIVPAHTVQDARIIPKETGGFQIEFNPNRPTGRIRFSIAHEISHTFFPDCSESIHNRLLKNQIENDDWEMEMLCNIGAAEILMPLGTFPTLNNSELTIDSLVCLQKKFDVSIESLLIRVVQLSDFPIVMYSCSRRSGDASSVIVDYCVKSRSFKYPFNRGHAVHINSTVNQCLAIGYTAKGREKWDDGNYYSVECIGVPSVIGRPSPRVIGFAKADIGKQEIHREIVYLKGDATEPRKAGIKIIAQVVNDESNKWGGRGFAKFISDKWPHVFKSFAQWRRNQPQLFKLGNIHVASARKDIYIVNMIAQHGYGKSATPRIKYADLAACLRQLGDIAHSFSATVHMPRIGTGAGGGTWEIISQLINQHLIGRKIDVFVYDLP